MATVHRWYQKFTILLLLCSMFILFLGKLSSGNLRYKFIFQSKLQGWKLFLNISSEIPRLAVPGQTCVNFPTLKWRTVMSISLFIFCILGFGEECFSGKNKDAFPRRKIMEARKLKLNLSATTHSYNSGDSNNKNLNLCVFSISSSGTVHYLMWIYIFI